MAPGRDLLVATACGWLSPCTYTAVQSGARQDQLPVFLAVQTMCRSRAQRPACPPVTKLDASGWCGLCGQEPLWRCLAWQQWVGRVPRHCHPLSQPPPPVRPAQ